MPLPNLPQIPQAVNGVVLFPQGKSVWSIVVPEDTYNYFKAPSFEAAAYDTEVNSANVTLGYSTTWSWRGQYSRQITISTTAANYYGKRVSASSGVMDTAGVAHCFSVYVYSPTAETFRLEVHTSLDAYASTVAQQTFKATGRDNDRFSLVFFTPTGVSSSTIYEFRVVRTNATTNTYYTDAWQIEPKGYPTTYCDGDQPGCIWLGLAQGSVSSRPLWLAASNPSQVTGGRVYNLNDIFLYVQAYQGAGMPPIQHTSQRRALQGGDFYQRSLPSFRVFTLACYMAQATLQKLQSLKQALIGYVSPDVGSQQARPLMLTYQTVDACGNPVGKLLEVPVLYLSGLEGNADNLFQETFNLQFTEYNPPSIQEAREYAASLNFADNTPSHNSLIRFSNGTWVDGTTTTTGFAAIYDNQGNPWVMTGTQIRTFDGTTALALTAGPTFAAFCTDTGNNLYAGGDFTSAAGNYVVKYDGSSFSAMAGLNGGAFGLLGGVEGYIWAVGAFTTPGNRIAQWNGLAWSSSGFGTGLDGPGYSIAQAKDGTVYVGGNFANANGVSALNIVKYSTAGAFSALSSGINGQVYALTIGPDGTLYAGGNFTLAGGVTCRRVARWNGAQWQPLGPGLSSAVYTLKFGADGYLYAGGDFTALGDASYPITTGLVRWNGSVWLPVDFRTTSFVRSMAFNPAGDMLLGVQGSPNYVGSLNVITYNGSAGCYPRLKITGPGQLYQLTNNTTKKSLYFNYLLQTNEFISINTDPKNFSITSSLYGNIAGRLLPGSDVTSFGFTPGTNRITAYMISTGGLPSMQALYKNLHWSTDASGAL